MMAAEPNVAGERSPGEASLGFDTTVAHPARVYDYWLGGKDNFAADREAAERVLAAAPGLRTRVRANRAFLARVVRFLVGSAGITQFLDIGTGIPSPNISHPAVEINPGQQEAQKRYNERVSTPQTLRTQSDVARFFTGLELVEPGLVQVHQWRPEAGDPVPDDGTSAHGGLARKP